MGWNPWKHLRFIGALCCIIAFVISDIRLTLIGLMIIAVAVVGAINRIERLIELTQEKENGLDK